MAYNGVMSFGDWLAEELKQRDWSHSELARRAGLSQVSVSGVIAGQRNPGCEFCVKVADALGVSAVLVMRKAGILPPGPDEDPALAELLAAAKGLTAEQIQEVIRFVRFLRRG